MRGCQHTLSCPVGNPWRNERAEDRQTHCNGLFHSEEFWIYFFYDPHGDCGTYCSLVTVNGNEICHVGVNYKKISFRNRMKW